MTKPKVILIAGSAHGGTTILSMVLSQHPDIFATGKLRDFPRGDLFNDSKVCSCGSPSNLCPFWKDIRERFKPLQDKPEQQRIPELFALISRVSGHSFVCDVSHNTGYAQRMADIEGIDLYLVHVVRDGRNMVYSRIRKDQRVGRTQAVAPLDMARVFSVSRRWLKNHSAFSRLEKKLGARAVRVHHEELCRNPRATLQSVGDCLGLDFSEVGRRLAEGQPLERVPHLIRGNKILRSSDDVVLRQPDTQPTPMSWTERLIFRLAVLLP